MAKRRFLQVIVLVLVLLIIIPLIIKSERQFRARRLAEHRAEWCGQVVAVRVAVEKWVELNHGRYPASLNDITDDTGQTVIDFLPHKQRMKNAFVEGTTVLSEPRLWPGNSTMLLGGKGEIYYCPKSDCSGAWLRAYDGSKTLHVLPCGKDTKWPPLLQGGSNEP